MESSLSPSPTLNRIQCSRHVQGVLRCVGQRWKGPKQSGEGCAGEGEGSTVSENATLPVTQAVQIEERPLGPVKTIIDKWIERSCVEKSERVLAGEATADSSTAERKVRQQVEQRLKERKRPKV